MTNFATLGATASPLMDQEVSAGGAAELRVLQRSSIVEGRNAPLNLSNTGSDCSFNSILQSLASIPALVSLADSPRALSADGASEDNLCLLLRILRALSGRGDAKGLGGVAKLRAEVRRFLEAARPGGCVRGAEGNICPLPRGPERVASGRLGSPSKATMLVQAVPPEATRSGTRPLQSFPIKSVDWSLEACRRRRAAARARFRPLRANVGYAAARLWMRSPTYETHLQYKSPMGRSPTSERGDRGQQAGGLTVATLQSGSIKSLFPRGPMVNP